MTADFRRLDRLTQAAKEMSQATGSECIPAQGDVRSPADLKAAVATTIAKFGRIDFVICGTYHFHMPYVYRVLPLISCVHRRCRELPSAYLWHVRERV